jgi:hypothetical protein
MTRKGLTQRQRFEQYIAKDGKSNCIIWYGSIATNGYGRFDNEQAHRLSYKLYVCAEIPIDKDSFILSGKNGKGILKGNTGLEEEELLCLSVG